MTNRLLLNLLRAGLLGDLGDDEQRRGYVEAAARDMTEWLAGEGRPKFAAALLCSLDESAAAIDDPVLGCAYGCLLDAWPSVPNAFAKHPTELLRAVALQAAVSAAARDQDLEAAAWYVLRTVSALGLSVGRWEEVVRDEASRIDETVSDRLNRMWLPSPDTRKLRMPPTADSDDGSQDGSELSAFAEKLGVALRAQVQSQWAVVEASRLRETLLWWHLAAYSDVLGARYADIDDPALCAIAAAVDIRRLVPRAAPVAVEHLLGAAMASNSGTAPSITTANLASAWERIEPECDVSVDGYGLVVSSIAAGDPDVSALTVPEGLTPADAATLMFRDLQIVGLLAVSAA